MWSAPEMNCVCDYDAMHCARWLRKGRGRRRYRGSKIHLNTFAFPLTRPIICGHYTHWLESLPSESSWTSTWHLELQCKYFISPQLAPLHLRQWRHLLLVIISLHPETVFALDLDPTTTTNYFVSVLFSTPTTSGPPWVTRCGRGGWLAAWNLVLHVPTGARVHDWWVLTDYALFVRAMMMMVCKKSDQRPPPGMGKNCRLFI